MPVKKNPAIQRPELLLSKMKKNTRIESNWINKNNIFERQTIEFFNSIERMTNMYIYVESRKSAAPKATLPQEGKDCEVVLNLVGVSKTPCANKDRIAAEIKSTLGFNDDNMLFTWLRKSAFVAQFYCMTRSSWQGYLTTLKVSDIIFCNKEMMQGQ